MKLILYTVIGLIAITLNAQNANQSNSTSLNIIPKPESVVMGNEQFIFKNGLTIITRTESQKKAAQHLQNFAQNTLGLKLKTTTKKKGQIIFQQKENLAHEAYQLEITSKHITVYANDAAGYFYGVQSLKQLFPAPLTKASKYTLATMSIVDQPRFKWRAYMLDESRYFHGEAFVKQMLDQMALLKMNTFHWHLIDDAGWRVQINKYPLLTEVGAFRKDSEIGTWKSGKTSGEPHGGFYTQEQIKDIVAYAAERHINVVPEFEMPGHSSAAIAAYTWLGTAGIDIDVPVKFGRLYDNYDVTKPEVITFIKDVLNELFDLFPSEVIHIGGDEVGYKVWEESESVQKYMKEHNIKTPADLQVNFTNKISKFIESKGRRMMGWNEIMGKNIHKGFEEKKDDKDAETELAKNVIVHFWKGDIDLLTDAAKKGYGIVNSLHSSTYLDYNYKSIPLEKAYNFNPIPDGLDAQYHKNIYGLGCQMWSEWTPTNPDVERQTFPRIAAYAEVGWTAPKNKDYNSFLTALEKLRKHWDNLGINYYKDFE